MDPEKLGQILAYMTLAAVPAWVVYYMASKLAAPFGYYRGKGPNLVGCAATLLVFFFAFATCVATRGS